MIRKNVLILCLSMFIAGIAVAQEPIPSENAASLSVATDVSVGFFSNQIGDFQVKNQPMVSASVFSKLNPNLFVGGGVGLATWNYSDNDGTATIENKNYSLPIYLTARYVFRTSEANLFFDGKIGYRLGNEVKIDMLSEYRTGQDYRIVDGKGLFSAAMMGFSVRNIELGIGLTLQKVSYDMIDHSVVIATDYHRDAEEHSSKMMYSFFVQAGYWF